MTNSIVDSILNMQNSDGSWEDPKRFYTDKYKGTVWNLIILGELNADISDSRVKKACEFVLSNSYDKTSGGFSVSFSAKYQSGMPSQVIPCLTGNMVFSLIRLGYLDDERVQNAIEWIVKYQRADDGNHSIQQDDKYSNLKACFSKHTCFMGVVKSLKALAEIPEERKSERIKGKINELCEFMLKHHVYKKSTNLKEVAKPGWLRFGFPLMYQTDVLEIMDIFSKLKIKDDRLTDAVNIIKNKQINDEWILEQTMNGKTLVDIGKKGSPCEYITKRAKNILSFYTEF